MKQFDSLIDALNDLKSRGYTIDFNLKDTHLYCDEHNLALTPDEFDIDETYRFEGMTDPDDSSVLYAISSHHGKKGVLVNAYGAYSDSASADMVAKLSTHPH